MMTQKSIVMYLLDVDLLMVAKRWIQALPNGALGYDSEANYTRFGGKDGYGRSGDHAV